LVIGSGFETYCGYFLNSISIWSRTKLSSEFEHGAENDIQWKWHSMKMTSMSALNPLRHENNEFCSTSMFRDRSGMWWCSGLERQRFGNRQWGSGFETQLNPSKPVAVAPWRNAARITQGSLIAFKDITLNIRWCV
jgi:hypothetical protein